MYSKVGGISTHSRAKAAGEPYKLVMGLEGISTHSRAKAAGQRPLLKHLTAKFQLTAARRRLVRPVPERLMQPCHFNSQPREGGWETIECNTRRCTEFQLTAARRRLDASRTKPEVVAVFQLTAARRRLGR